MTCKAVMWATFLAVSAMNVFAQLFPSTCPDGSALPSFSAIEVPQDIDGSCGPAGKETSGDSVKLQNSAKNNFCAPGPVTDMTPADLADLQGKAADAGISFGDARNPAGGDRSGLQQLGEGKLVRLKVFLIEAHHADVSSGESVNCGIKGEAGNDIHIAFGDAADSQECGSVTAEITPHFRPASWNEIGHFEVYDSSAHQYVPDPVRAARLQSVIYRVTGPLFFDASPKPCPCGTSCSPQPVSLREIHPVYSVDVCKAGTACDATDDSQWMPFDSWWSSLPQPQVVLGPHKHSDTPTE